jgi:imidazolonepropionase-like amidohydrolase
VFNEVDVAALVPVVRGQTKLLVRAERANDLTRILELKREFPNLDLVLVGAQEGWMVADRIAAARVPVITSALDNLPGSFERLGATQSNVGRLVRAGVKVALGLIDDDDGRQIRLLPQHAGNLVALSKVPGAVGLTHAQALATITSAPAEIFGLTDVGMLGAGKRADVVLWDGDPLELSSAPTMVMIDGRPVPLDSRQTKLRDRYHPSKDRTKLPLHYQR